MTITITHPRAQGHRIRNTMIAAVVAVLVGVASYSIAEIARDRGSGPEIQSNPAIETNTVSEATPSIQNSAESVRGLAPAGAVALTPPGDVRAQLTEWIQANGAYALSPDTVGAVAPSATVGAQLTEWIQANGAYALLPESVGAVAPSATVGAQLTEWIQANGAYALSPDTVGAVSPSATVRAQLAEWIQANGAYALPPR